MWIKWWCCLIWISFCLLMINVTPKKQKKQSKKNFLIILVTEICFPGVCECKIYYLQLVFFFIISTNGFFFWFEKKQKIIDQINRKIIIMICLWLFSFFFFYWLNDQVWVWSRLETHCSSLFSLSMMMDMIIGKLIFIVLCSCHCFVCVGIFHIW